MHTKQKEQKKKKKKKEKQNASPLHEYFWLPSFFHEKKSEKGENGKGKTKSRRAMRKAEKRQTE